MKSDLKLTKNDIGSDISIKTNDGFFLEGQIKTVTDTNVEIKDLKTKNIFTIYIFEIKELEIIRNNGERERKFDQVSHSIPSMKSEPVKYDHMVFGSLFHDERELNYCEVNEIDMGKLLENSLEDDVYICRYLFLNAKDFRRKEDLYKKAIRYLSVFKTIGVSLYSNEDGVENKVNSKVYKYLTLSVPHLDLVLDLDKLSGQEFQRSHEDLVALLTSETKMKLVNLAQHIVPGVASVLQVEMKNFLDIQMLHYGLHNLRAASAFKAAQSYCQLVALLFCVEFKLANKTSFTADDVVRKMAFNAHFLVPMFELMSARLLEPVRLISRRVCCLHADSWDLHDALLDLSLADSAGSQLDYDILPRSSQFWSYQDHSGALQARRAADSEVQNEKQAARGGVRDVCEIKRNLAIAEEMTKRVNDYYEEVSDDDEEIGAAQGALLPSSKWNRKSAGPEQTREAAPTNGHARPGEAREDKTSKVVCKIGLGRGRGVGRSAPVETAKSVGSSGSGRSIELTRSEDFLDDVNNCSTSTKYPRQDRSSAGAPGTPSSCDGMDKVFARGRGVSSSSRRKVSQSSGGALDNSWQPAAAKDSQDIEEFCELSARHWNRNSGAGAGKSGKLRLDRLPDDDSASSTAPACNQAMGIMWNILGMKHAQETEDLYAEFGL